MANMKFLSVLSIFALALSVTSLPVAAIPEQTGLPSIAPPQEAGTAELSAVNIRCVLLCKTCDIRTLDVFICPGMLEFLDLVRIHQMISGTRIIIDLN
jgi:hypothetical protein